MALIPISIIALAIIVMMLMAVGLTRIGIDDEFSMIIILLFAGWVIGLIYFNTHE